MALTVEEIHGLYREHGHVAYSGEPVTQLEHALQSGLLAEASGRTKRWSRRRSCTTSAIC